MILKIEPGHQNAAMNLAKVPASTFEKPSNKYFFLLIVHARCEQTSTAMGNPSKARYIPPTSGGRHNYYTGFQNIYVFSLITCILQLYPPVKTQLP